MYAQFTFYTDAVSLSFMHSLSVLSEVAIMEQKGAFFSICVCTDYSM